jgi:hypothetical protein
MEIVFHKAFSNTGYRFSLNVQNRTHLPLTVLLRFDSIRQVFFKQTEVNKWDSLLSRERIGVRGAQD